jgi:hypothetical protein
MALCFLLTGIIAVCADDVPAINADFTLATSDEIIENQWFNIEGDIEFQFDIGNRTDVSLELEADRDAVDVDDFYLRWKFPRRLRLQVGTFDNNLTLDEYLPEFKQLFASNNLLTDTLENTGYMSNTLSAMLIRKYKKKKEIHPLSYYFLVKQIPTNRWSPQFDAGIIYHYTGEDSWLGVFGSFTPDTLTSTLELDDLKPAYLLDIFIASYENRLKYGFEAVFASNIVAPVSVISHPAGFNEPSWLFGAEAHAGYSFSIWDMDWIPLLRCSVLLPETDQNVLQSEIIYGNKLMFSKDMLLHIDFGVEVFSDYFSDASESVTGAIWEITFKTRF